MLRGFAALVLLFPVCSATAAVLDFGPPVLLVPPHVLQIATQTDVQIAGDGAGFLAVWEDERGGIFGGRIDPAGHVLDPDGIVLGSGQLPQVTWTGTAYLAVWRSSDTGRLTTATIASDGTIGVRGSVDQGCFPGAIASNGETVLVGCSDGIPTVLLDTTGTFIRTIAKPFFAFWADAIATDGTDYLVLTGPHVLTRVSRSGDAELAYFDGNGGAGAKIAYGNGRYAVVWSESGTGRIRSRFFSQAGQPLSDPQDVFTVPFNAGDALSVRQVVWRGDEFVAVAAKRSVDTQSLYSAPIGGTATATELPKPWVEGSTAGAVGSLGDGRVVAVHVDPAQQRFVTGWLDPGGSASSVDAFTPTTTAMFPQLWQIFGAAGSLYALFYAGDEQLQAMRFGGTAKSMDVHTDIHARPAAADFIWFLEHDSSVGVRRYTYDLAPVDPSPTLLTNASLYYTNFFGAALAAADRAVLVAYPMTAANGYATMAAALVDGSNVTPVAIPGAEANRLDHSPAAVWTGKEFVVIWAHALGPEPTGDPTSAPGDEIRAVRVSRSGVVLDAQPVILGRSLSRVQTLRAATTAGRVAVAWFDRGVVFTPATLDVKPWTLVNGQSAGIAPMPSGFLVVTPTFGGLHDFPTGLEHRLLNLDGVFDRDTGFISDTCPYPLLAALPNSMVIGCGSSLRFAPIRRARAAR